MNRRTFLKMIGVSGSLLAFGRLSNANESLRKLTNQPNIVLFLVDDMGWQDTSVPFHSEPTPFNRRYRTPNMERLAEQGMKFTQAYACCVCSPTRVSLMTGLNAARHRVTNWTLRKNASNDARHNKLKFPAWNVNGLSPVPGIERTVYAKTLPQFLKESGYQTIHVGKAHFGAIGTPGEEPLNLGFDVNIGGHAAGGPGSYLGAQNFSAAWRKGDRVWDVPGLEEYHGKDIFLTEALTIEANKAMDDAIAKGKLFYLYMSHYAVHVPFAEDSRFIKKYIDAGLDPKEAMFAAMVEGMDKSLGDIMANIRRHHIEDNTVILFMSDNGGLSASGRGGKRHTHNKPLSSGKGSSHEGGVRVPMIVKWPGTTFPGSVCNDYVVGGEIDGVSFVPLLKGKRGHQKSRPLIWHFPNNWGPTGPGIAPHSAIRRGDWKLIYYHATQEYELFNIKRDVGEANNLFKRKPGITKQLVDELRGFLRQADAQMPINMNTGKSVSLPDI
jgi:arylsulfatase A-like enzyme